MGFRVDIFQLYSISESTGTRCTTAPPAQTLCSDSCLHLYQVIIVELVQSYHREYNWLWWKDPTADWHVESDVPPRHFVAALNFWEHQHKQGGTKLLRNIRPISSTPQLWNCHGELSLCPRETTTNSEELLPSISSQPLCWEILAHFLLLNTWFTIAWNEFSRVSRYLLWFL